MVCAFLRRLPIDPECSASGAISVYAEHLDLNRFGGEHHDEVLTSYLRGKFRDRPIGVIVAQGSAALEFVLRSRAGSCGRSAGGFFRGRQGNRGRLNSPLA